MMAVNETVLESQLEIVNKKMQQCENELFNKINDKLTDVMSQFESVKSQTFVSIV